MARKRISPKFKAKNERRLDLIDKKYSSDDETLSPEEAKELQELDAYVEKEIERVYPLQPTIDRLRALEKKLGIKD